MRYRGRGLLQLVWLLVVSTATLVFSGCAAGPGTATPTAVPSPTGMSSVGSTPSASLPGYTLTVKDGDKTLTQLSLDDLKGLPSVKLTADGKDQEGPTLLSVLQRSGVTQFKSVTVVGMQKGRTHSASLRLERAKVTDRTLLAFNERGQTKLASPDLPGETWVVDVSELDVER